MTSSSGSTSSRSRRDRALAWGLRASAALAGGLVLLVVGFLVLEAAPLIRQVGVERFATDGAWHPTEGRYGLGPMLAGTIYAALGAVALAAPIGIASAVFGQVYAPPRLARAYRRVLALLAGIPSVVYGVWGLVVLVPLIGRIEPPGASLLAGALILALMIVPTIALIADAALGAVPASYRLGAAALGLSRAAEVRRVLLPAARSGLATAVLLGTGRAIGETMAVLMVCGNVVQYPDSVFDPIRTLTANIALEMAYATGDHRAALFVSGLALVLVIAALIAAVEWTRLRRRW